MNEEIINEVVNMMLNLLVLLFTSYGSYASDNFESLRSSYISEHKMLFSAEGNDDFISNILKPLWKDLDFKLDQNNFLNVHEYTGNDLVRNEFHSLKTKSVKVFVFDSDFSNNDLFFGSDNHGDTVSTLITNPQKISHAYNAVISGVDDVEKYGEIHRIASLNIDYQPLNEQIIRNEINIFNMSNANWTINFLPYFEEAFKKKIVFVLSGGNSTDSQFAESVDSKYLKNIVVANIVSHDLFLSPQNPLSDKQDIYVPTGVLEGGTYLGSGRKALFGSSSAAAPIITGNLANVQSILGNVESASLKRLLKASAFKVQINEASFDVLNSYRLIKTAQRIKEVCNDDTQCKEKLIDEKTTYEYQITESDYANSYVSLKNNFSFCLDKKEKEQVSIKKIADLDSIRKLFFLKPRMKEAEILNCAYSAMGLAQVGNYFIQIAKEKKTDSDIYKLSGDKFIRHIEFLKNKDFSKIIQKVNTYFETLEGDEDKLSILIQNLLVQAIRANDMSLANYALNFSKQNNIEWSISREFLKNSNKVAEIVNRELWKIDPDIGYLCLLKKYHQEKDLKNECTPELSKKLINE